HVHFFDQCQDVTGLVVRGNADQRASHAPYDTQCEPPVATNRAPVRGRNEHLRRSGNILTLQKRAEWRGNPVEVRAGGGGPGLALVDLHTVPGRKRNIGNIVIETSELGLQPTTLVGFENHSGKTYLGPQLRPLGRVIQGAGNNSEDATEGVAAGNVFGTYLHGSLLPKNPHFADYLLMRALQRRGPIRFEPLDDTIEMAAHNSVRERIGAPR